VAKIRIFNIKSYISAMKIKLSIAILSAVLFVVFLMIDKNSVQDSAVDKWTSFGMGFMAPILVANLLSTVMLYRKLKAL
jgi:hypothetical protein